MSNKLPPDPTLDEIRTFLAPHIAAHAAFDGWNEKAVEAAAIQFGVDGDLARLAFKGGAMDLIDLWIASVDTEMEARFPPEKLQKMKIREKITVLVEGRLAIIASVKEAQRRAIAIMAMPQNLPRSGQIAWRTADRIWRRAGDSASDFNHYTKRATLTAIYTATIAAFMADDDPEYADSRAFLARRVENVMQFEKYKGQAKARMENMPSLSRFIGRLRYPSR